MDPFVLWLTVALGGLASYAVWITKRYITHLETENDRNWRLAERGTMLAEQGAVVAEKTASG